MESAFFQDRQRSSPPVRHIVVTNMHSNIRQAEAIARAWNNVGIDYVVAHGLEGYPDYLGRDLDVLVAPSDIELAQSILIDLLSNSGWRSVICRKPWANWILAFDAHTSSQEYVEIDLISHWSWGTQTLSRFPRSFDMVGPFRVDPWITFVKRDLLQLLGGNFPTIEKRLKNVNSNYDQKIVTNLSELVGQDLAKLTVQAFETKNIKILQSIAPRLRRNLLLKSVEKPCDAFVNTSRWIRNELFTLIAAPLSPIISLVGPDGSGKTSTRVRIGESTPPFTNTIKKHWRPNFLPSLGSLIGKPNVGSEQEGNLAPRRNRGRFHFFRLIYYWMDFVLGYHIKDRGLSSRLDLIVYDRCALDMAVDPVRYGLSSARGTRLLWRMIPKPDAVVLLYDDPERIYARKPELSVEEIDRQLGEWLRLAEEGEVDAIIRVDAPPEEIAKRVKEIIIEAFLEKNGVIGPKNDDIAWLNSILGQRTDPSAGSHNWRFGKLTLKDGRGYLIPLDSRRAAARALDVYPAQNRKSRLLKRGLAVGLRLGLAQPLLPKVWLAGHNEADQSVSPELFEHIKEILGRSDLCFGVSLGTPGTQQKPVIQAMTPDGQALAYVKIGWNPDITHLVTNEANTLRYLGEQNITAFDIPTVIHAGEWAGNHILVQSAPSLRGQPFSHTLMPEHLTVARTLANLGACEQALADSNWWSEFTTRVEQVTNYYYRSILDHCTQQVTDKAGNTVIPFHRCHGDFAPWNILTSGGRLYIFDWENSQPQAPPAWDLIRFQVQVLCLLKKCGPGQVVRSFQPGGDAYSALSAYLADLGLDSEWAERLFSLYMMDQLARYAMRNHTNFAERRALAMIVSLSMQSGAWQ